jgi:hypothetical protein
LNFVLCFLFFFMISIFLLSSISDAVSIQPDDEWFLFQIPSSTKEKLFTLLYSS